MLDAGASEQARLLAGERDEHARLLAGERETTARECVMQQEDAAREAAATKAWAYPRPLLRST